MEHAHFEIGKEFKCGETRYLCTDIGARVIVAIPIEKIEIGARAETGEVTFRTIDNAEVKEVGWLTGPPYAIAEQVFDEEDQKACSA